MKKRTAFYGGLIVMALLMTACSSGSGPDQYSNGVNGRSSTADATFVEFAAGDRDDPVEFSGQTDIGMVVSSEDYAGQVVVVNFWYAACGPCRAEAPDLRAIHLKYEGAGASFVGVNVYDQADTALAFARKYGITYPSILDSESGEVRLAFSGSAPPSAVPTTLVLDKEGRVAARFLGQILAPSNLDTVVRELIAEEL